MFAAGCTSEIFPLGHMSPNLPMPLLSGMLEGDRSLCYILFVMVVFLWVLCFLFVILIVYL